MFFCINGQDIDYGTLALDARKKMEAENQTNI